MIRFGDAPSLPSKFRAFRPFRGFHLHQQDPHPRFVPFAKFTFKKTQFPHSISALKIPHARQPTHAFLQKPWLARLPFPERNLASLPRREIRTPPRSHWTWKNPRRLGRPSYRSDPISRNQRLPRSLDHAPPRTRTRHQEISRRTALRPRPKA